MRPEVHNTPSRINICLDAIKLRLSRLWYIAVVHRRCEREQSHLFLNLVFVLGV